jgi:hypothetical protein
MLIPAKALTYGGPRSQIQVQLPNGKILPAIAATPINSPRVAVGFDQQGQAWVWGEVSKNDLQSTSIRKNRPSPNQEPVYPFKVIAQWGDLGYIAQAGDRSSQQVEAQKILAFGNRGKKKNDFILLTEIETDQYRLKNREGEKNLNFSSPEILETFKTNGTFYGDDYYGILLRGEQGWNNSDIITITTGDSANGTTRYYTPDGGYEYLQTRSRIGTTLEFSPPTWTLYSPPGDPGYGTGITYTSISLIPLPDPFEVSGSFSSRVVSPEERAIWHGEINACVAGLVNREPSPPIIKGGTSTKNFEESITTNTQSRKRLVSGFLDSISKVTATDTLNQSNTWLVDGQFTVTPTTTLIASNGTGGGYCSSTFYPSFPVNGAYYEFTNPYYEVFDQTSSTETNTDNDISIGSYNNSIPININNFNAIDYTINAVSNSNYTSINTFSLNENEAGGRFNTRKIEETDTRNAVSQYTNEVTGIYKGADELCLYSKIDSKIASASAVRSTRREMVETVTQVRTRSTTTNGQTEDNTIIPRRIYLANRENNLVLNEDYFYIRVKDIKNKINLSQLTTPFSFNIAPADRQETIGRFPLYFDYPIKYSVNSVVGETGLDHNWSNPNTITISNSATLINSYSDEYYISPDTSYPIELIVFEGDAIYKLSGTATANYQNTTKTFTASNAFFSGDYGQFSYSEATLSTISVTIQNYQLIKYHALKEVNTDTFGHLYSSANCLGLFQKLLGTNFTTSGITRTTLYKRINNQIIMAFSDNSNLIKKGERYADLYRLQGNQFIREGEKKGAYYPVLNPNSSSDPTLGLIGYYD